MKIRQEMVKRCSIDGHSLEPPRETRLSSRNQGYNFSEGSPREASFGSSYREESEIEGSGNRDSTVFTLAIVNKREWL